MKAKTSLLLIVLALGACGPSEQERAAAQQAWIKACSSPVGGFTPQQCTVLFALHDEAVHAKQSADTAATLGAVNIGMAAGRAR